MLHIILLILKIIGIILLAILGLLLLIVLSVLFVPVRYQISAQKLEKIGAFVHVTWLLHLLHIEVTFQDMKLNYKVKIFGFALLNSNKGENKHPDPDLPKEEEEEDDEIFDAPLLTETKEDEAGKKDPAWDQEDHLEQETKERIPDENEEASDFALKEDEPDECDEEEDADLLDEEVEFLGTEEIDLKLEEEISLSQAMEIPTDQKELVLSDALQHTEIVPIEEIEEQSETEEVKEEEETKEFLPLLSEQEEIPDLDEEEPDLQEEEESGERKQEEKIPVTEKIKGIFSKIKSIFDKVKNTVEGIGKKKQNLEKTIEKTKRKMNRFYKFLTNECTKASLKHIKKEVFYLLKHFLPKKMSGRIHFGFEDPSLTGRLLGYLWAFNAFIKNSLVIEEDFEHPVLEGKLQIKGHVRVCHAVKSGLSLILDKNIRITLKRLRKLKG